MEIEEVLPRDAIRSIDDPEFASTYFGEPDDEVVVVDGDPPRAYPVRILSYHEIVNDAIHGTGRGGDRTDVANVPESSGGTDSGQPAPVAVTWCPICWSAIVYERTVGDRTLTFGVSGNLADDSLVLYDHETESEWQQTNGRCVRGELEGATLTVRASRVVTYERFREESPDGLVLRPVRGHGAGETPSAVYDMRPFEGYRSRDAFGLYGMRGEGSPRSWDRTDLDPKTLVVGIEHGEHAVAYPQPAVASAGGVVTDTVDGVDVVVFADEDQLYVYENPGIEFERTDDGIRGDGTNWIAATGAADDGRRLTPVKSRRMFAFAWQDIYGPGSFYRE